ncbi:bifunctional methylenetetrahydrofolate dehydrogenase/cyclohydrolase, mitochondrial [Ischnura elegans]|uniref:bifunctional methylenetetrahydrofolate dehydrogenase/cyclohydrolase, mitochondrial n=1 Tax=Ischnura elegans TaxID=197161 RepID=UPI001ED86A01|nr:bifunctional methylenetetrahydrofolate dehydrogenase/cyclohydrolase, mitochondrial [Ischnura elegans]
MLTVTFKKLCNRVCTSLIPLGNIERRFFQTTNHRLVAKIIDGRKIAKDIYKELKTELDEWMALGHRRPTLVAILVGENPASQIYIRNKMRAAKGVGIKSTTEKYPEVITEGQLLDRVRMLNANKDVDGILVQLPLPDHISESAVCNTIDPNKDVDGFHLVNVGRLCLDLKSIIPCTPYGVQEILKRAGIETFGKHAVVCGRSKNVGMPIAVLLHADGSGETSAMDATTTICHRYTPPALLAMLTKCADIVITAAGVPNLVTPDMVKPGACIIDVGINRVTDPTTGKSRLIGDVDFEGVKEVAGHITPVPGGVGPVTVAMLMKNTFLAAKRIIPTHR